MLITNIC